MVSIKQIIKNNKKIRQFGQKLNTLIQFRQDTIDFNKEYLESAKNRGDYRYSILLNVHSLEKGMCFDNPRPFGESKVKELMAMLNTYMGAKKSDFEYKAGISVLFAWQKFYLIHGWDHETIFKDVQSFLLDKTESNDFIVGCKNFKPIIDEKYSDIFKNILSSRHSVRDFQDRKIDYRDIEYALKCFLETPTACNRQMCRVYYIQDLNVKELLNKVIVGISGFRKETVQYFVITYDLASLAYSGERQQGMFNAGLCTMNFVNGLHVRGIGSCCLQWSNKSDQDLKVRRAMKLSSSERIGIVIGAGYYLKDNLIPCSVRRVPTDIYKTI